MANLSGVASGYLQNVQDEQARAESALKMRGLLQNLMQVQAQQKARAQWGNVLQGMMGGQAAPGGVPPPPGTAAGGPQPPGPGVSSAPPPMPPQAPPQAAPQPQGAIAPPPGAVGQAPAPALAAAAPAGPPTPYKPMPTTPQAPPPAAPAPGMVPPPPQAAAAPMASQSPQFGLTQILAGLKRANVPPEQWGDMLDNLPEPIKNQAAGEIRLLKQQNDFLLNWAKLQEKTSTDTRKLEQGDTKLTQGQQRLAIAGQKLGIDQSKLTIMQQKLRDAEQNDSVQFDPQDVSYWTEVVKDGGNLPPGLARTVGGRKLIQQVMHGVSVGTTAPSEMLANQAEFQGLKAGERTLGTRSANIEMAATEAASLADLALMASSQVPRTDIKTANDFIQMVEKGTSDPKLRAFIASNTSLINAYARAINPQGVGTVADKEHARDMLATAFPKGDYEAAVNQLLQEITAAKKSPGTVKGEIRERFTGAGARKAAPAGDLAKLKSYMGTPDEEAAVKFFVDTYGYLPAGVRSR